MGLRDQLRDLRARANYADRSAGSVRQRLGSRLQELVSRQHPERTLHGDESIASLVAIVLASPSGAVPGEVRGALLFALDERDASPAARKVARSALRMRGAE